MSRFEVVPVSLESAGSRLAATADRIAGIRAQVAATSSAGAAMGDGEAAPAFSGMLCTWDSELARIAGSADTTGVSTIRAANLYELVDGSLFAATDAGEDGAGG